MKLLSLVSAVAGLVKAGSTDSVTKKIGEASELVGELFENEQHAQDFAQKMEELQNLSQSALARTGRGALVWAMSIILVYQMVIRELLVAFGLVLPESSVDAGNLLLKLSSLFLGA